MLMLAQASADPDVINNAFCDWIANYPVLLMRAVPLAIWLERM